MDFKNILENTIPTWMRMRPIFLTLLGMVSLLSLNHANASDLFALEKYLDEFSTKIGLNGNVFIATNNEVLFSKSYGFSNFQERSPLTYESQFYIGSVTKQFTAVAILRLVQEGKISLEDKISKLIPEFSRTPWAQDVTIKHLLNHTSGIFEPNPLENQSKPPFSKVEDVISYLKDKHAMSELGKLFLYSNNGYLVLGYIIEKITQKSLDVYLKQAFFDPLEMASTCLSAYTPYEKHYNLRALPHLYKDGGMIDILNQYYVDFPFSAGGLISTVEDLWKWNKALYEGKIIADPLIKEFTTPHLLGYGLGITIETFANGTIVYKHGGSIDGYHSLLIYLPQQKMTVCVLTNVDYPSPHRMEALMSTLTMMIDSSEIGT